MKSTFKLSLLGIVWMGGVMGMRPFAHVEALPFAAAQDAPEETPAEKLARGLKLLETLKPGLDQETLKYLPAVEDTIRHWAAGDELGVVELDVIGTLGLGARDSGDSRPDFSAMRTKLMNATGNMVKQAAKFKFDVRTSDLRGIKRGIVNLHVVEPQETPDTKRETPIVTFMTPAGGMSQLERADKVAKRMRGLSVSNPTWWTEMRVSQTADKQPLYFIATRRAPAVPLVTADPAWAHEAGYAPTKLVTHLIDEIHNVVADRARGDKEPVTIEEKHTAAFLVLQEGDKAFEAKDLKAAKKAYQDSCKLDPGYLTPRLGLVELYLKQKDRQAARAELARAANLPGLTPEDKAAIALMKAHCK